MAIVIKVTPAKGEQKTSGLSERRAPALLQVERSHLRPEGYIYPIHAAARRYSLINPASLPARTTSPSGAACTALRVSAGYHPVTGARAILDTLFGLERLGHATASITFHAPSRS